MDDINFPNIDHTTRPQDDFYQHVNGKWLDSTEIPSDKGRYGAFTELNDANEDKILKILEEFQHSSDVDAKQAYDLYTSYLDTDSRNQQGLSSLKSILDSISTLSSKDDLANCFAKLAQLKVGLPVNLVVDLDEKNNSQYILTLFQGRLSLPDRDYYLENKEPFIGYQEKYKQYIKNLLENAGLNHDSDFVNKIYDLEKKLAQIQWSKTESRDPIKTYNKTDLETFCKKHSSFPWKKFFIDANIFAPYQNPEIIIAQDSYFDKLDAVFAQTDLATWQAYLTLHTLNSFASNLTTKLEATKFDFYGKTLSGIKEPRAAHKQAKDLVDKYLPDTIAKRFVAKYFAGESKSKIEQLVHNLKLAYKEIITNLPWMQDATKQKALEKLAALQLKTGHPENYKDYSNININQASLCANVQSARRANFARDIKKLGSPVDKDEWFMSAHQVNAYFAPNRNEIVFPAGILQAPFFSSNAPDAMNYGGIGMVIGHEIGHAFDDQGRKYDATGQLNDWWTKEDGAQFEKRSLNLVAQFNNFAPIPAKPELTVNGELTLGENIGDLAGLTASLKALEKHSSPTDEDAKREQRQHFFLNYAQIWRNKSREQTAITLLKSDPHSPPKYRVNGAIANMPEFHEAFDVGPDDPMHLPEEKRTKIWTNS